MGEPVGEPVGSLARVSGAPRAPARLAVRQLSVRFGGVQALDHVDLRVQAGQLVGLIGPNGAGKTTLFDCVCGVVRPDAGTVELDGRRIDDLAVHRRARLGLARTFQRVEVFPELTVLDHLLVAERARRADGGLWKDLCNRGSPRPQEVERCWSVLVEMGLEERAEVPVAALSLGHCRLVELARALVSSPRLLLADEPSSGLDASETAAVGAALRHALAAHDLAVLLVEHDLDLVESVADSVVVLDAGRVIADGATTKVLSDATVRRAYLGRAP